MASLKAGKAENTVIQLTDREFLLILALRERYRFGVVSLLLHEGVIQKLITAEKFNDVGVDSDTLTELIKDTCPNGEVTIKTKNGRPYRLVQTLEFDYLDK